MTIPAFIAPQPVPYRSQCPWPERCDLRYGESGLVVTRSSSGAGVTWYFQASLPDLGRSFQAEGVSLIAAEVECFAKYQRACQPVASHRGLADAVAG